MKKGVENSVRQIGQGGPLPAQFNCRTDRTQKRHDPNNLAMPFQGANCPEAALVIVIP
jgi:hypothetical protein